MSVEVLASRPVCAPSLARTPASPSTAAAAPEALERLASQYLAFRLGNEEYGLDTRHVGEIRGYSAATRIANAPAFLKGVISLRGTIIPIVDLRIKLGVSDPAYGDTTVTIVVNVDDQVMGIVVDAVSDVLHLDAAVIKPPPRFTSGTVDVEHVLGIATLGDGDARRMLMLVDIRRWLADASFWRP